MIEDLDFYAEENGQYLDIKTDEEGWHSFRIPDEMTAKLDKALQLWRDHQAEGAAVKAEFDAHKRTGACTSWAPGKGPCSREAGHDGDHE